MRADICHISLPYFTLFIYNVKQNKSERSLSSIRQCESQRKALSDSWDWHELRGAATVPAAVTAALRLLAAAFGSLLSVQTGNIFDTALI